MLSAQNVSAVAACCAGEEALHDIDGTDVPPSHRPQALVVMAASPSRDLVKPSSCSCLFCHNSFARLSQPRPPAEQPRQSAVGAHVNGGLGVQWLCGANVNKRTCALTRTGHARTPSRPPHSGSLLPVCFRACASRPYLLPRGHAPQKPTVAELPAVHTQSSAQPATADSIGTHTRTAAKTPDTGSEVFAPPHSGSGTQLARSVFSFGNACVS